MTGRTYCILTHAMYQNKFRMNYRCRCKINNKVQNTLAIKRRNSRQYHCSCSKHWEKLVLSYYYSKLMHQTENYFLVPSTHTLLSFKVYSEVNFWNNIKKVRINWTCFLYISWHYFSLNWTLLLLIVSSHS